MQLAVFLPLFMHYALITNNAASCILATIYALRPDCIQCSWLYSCHYLCITPWLQTMQLAVFLPLFMHYALITDNAAGCILATIYALRPDLDNTAGCILATIYALRPDCRPCSWLYSYFYLCITPWLQKCSWLYSSHYLCITPWLQTMKLVVFLSLFMHSALIADSAAGCILATIYECRPDCRQCSWLYSCHY